MNKTPQGERVRISFFGKVNTGKSSLINAITNQDVSIVSPTAGTTTDPVQKTMELLPLGPVILTDTAGLDDNSLLGHNRIAKSMDILKKTDIAILVAQNGENPSSSEKELLTQLTSAHQPVVLVLNKCDLQVHSVQESWEKLAAEHNTVLFCLSAKEKTGIKKLMEHLSKMLPDNNHSVLISDLVHENETVVLVVPIDSAAPKGRLILPQQQVIRELLDTGVKAFITRETEYVSAISGLKKPPALVVTDSQVFEYVSKNTPPNIPLTSFSILFARYKGDLEAQVNGAYAADRLCGSDKVLICEGCTHHRQCDDIGTVKLPKWLEAYTGKRLEYTFVSGTEFPRDLNSYSLIIHCGGCMLSAREMRYRISSASGVPITNYGVLIAHMNGILPRVLSPFEQTKPGTLPSVP